MRRQITESVTSVLVIVHVPLHVFSCSVRMTKTLMMIMGVSLADLVSGSLHTQYGKITGTKAILFTADCPLLKHL